MKIKAVVVFIAVLLRRNEKLCKVRMTVYYVIIIAMCECYSYANEPCRHEDFRLAKKSVCIIVPQTESKTWIYIYICQYFADIHPLFHIPFSPVVEDEQLRRMRIALEHYAMHVPMIQDEQSFKLVHMMQLYNVSPRGFSRTLYLLSAPWGNVHVGITRLFA